HAEAVGEDDLTDGAGVRAAEDRLGDTVLRLVNRRRLVRPADTQRRIEQVKPLVRLLSDSVTEPERLGELELLTTERVHGVDRASPPVYRLRPVADSNNLRVSLGLHDRRS